MIIRADPEERRALASPPSDSRPARAEIYICIYIYIYRDRERERERYSYGFGKVMCIYIYIHTYAVTKPPAPEPESIRRAHSNKCFFSFRSRVIFTELFWVREPGRPLLATPALLECRMLRIIISTLK